MSDIWTVKAALDWTTDYLARKGDKNSLLSAQWLMTEATGLSKVDLYVNFERPLSMEERDVLRGFVKRRATGEPLQYITGEVAFRHITVAVEPGVLIPRPETEVLVSVGLSLLPARHKRVATDSRMLPEETAALILARAQAAEGKSTAPAAESVTGITTGITAGATERDFAGYATSENQQAAPQSPANQAFQQTGEVLLVADICTGSGCIGCSIAYERPDTRVFATDIAPAAVLLARQNAERTGVSERMQVVECDLGEGLDANFLESFDLVISNPPYVPTPVLSQLPREVSAFEPTLALDGGSDGLKVFRRLAAWSMLALRPGAGFAFELHEDCLDAARTYAQELGFVDIGIENDLTGRPRVLYGRKPSDACL